MISRLPFHTMSGKELINKLYAGDKFFCNRFVFKRRGETYNCYLTTVHDQVIKGDEWIRIDCNGKSNLYVNPYFRDLSRIKLFITEDCDRDTPVYLVGRYGG